MFRVFVNLFFFKQMTAYDMRISDWSSDVYSSDLLAILFEWKFAVSGVIANLHDVVIILGFFAFFQWEFSLSVLAGVLAVLGYSVNESVIIMDRIRENFRKQRKASTREIIKDRKSTRLNSSH